MFGEAIQTRNQMHGQALIGESNTLESRANIEAQNPDQFVRQPARKSIVISTTIVYNLQPKIKGQNVPKVYEAHCKTVRADETHCSISQ
jgi:hypothetical protein